MRFVLTFAVLLSTATIARADLVISQFYEGSSSNKWIELFNSGTSNFDLSTVTLGLWQNANTENYKSNGAPNQSLTLSGTLASGGIYLLANPSAVTPSYASADATSGSVINFNGDDSVALYTGGAFATANIIDAIGFTDSGNEGSNTSWVRNSLAAGFDTSSGSDVEDFAVWTEFSNAAVDGAAVGSTERLGVTTLTVAIPEPSAFLFGSLICGVMGMNYSRKRERN